MKPETDRTGWIIFFTVLGAFILLICAWVFFFWIAAQNRVADVSLEPAQPVQPAEAAQPVQPAEAAQPAQNTQSAQNTQFVESAQPAENTQPLEPVTTPPTVQPVEAAQPTAVTETPAAAQIPDRSAANTAETDTAMPANSANEQAAQ